MVTKGYYGEDEIDTIASNQVVRIHSIDKQKRVVATDSRGRLLSIPEDYPIKFEILDNRKNRRGKRKRLKDIVNNTSYKFPLHVEFEKKRRWTFRIGSQKYSSTNFGNLTLEREHWRTFLKGNTINNGVLDTKVILIPSYLDILWCVAEGYQSGSREEWRDVLSTLNRNVDSNKLDSCIGSKNIILYRSEKERQNYQVNHINHVDYVKGVKSLQHNPTTVAKASTKVKKINSMNRHNYQNSYQKSDRPPAHRANWTKVMDLDGMNHQSNYQHQSATYSSNPGHYSSKVHVKQDDVDVISSETSSLSFDSNIPTGQTIHHTTTRHEPSQVYYQPGRTHIYQRNKRAHEAPARYHSHQHVINIPLRRAASAENFHDMSYSSLHPPSVFSEGDYQQGGTYVYHHGGTHHRKSHGTKVNSPGGRQDTYSTLPTGTSRGYTKMQPSPNQAPVITNVHTQRVTSGSKTPMHSAVGSPQNVVSTSSYSYEDEVFHRNTLPHPQRSYYVRRPGIDSSRTLAKKAPVLLHSPPHTVTRNATYASQPSNTLHQNGYAEFYADNITTTRQVHTTYTNNDTAVNHGYQNNVGVVNPGYPRNSGTITHMEHSGNRRVPAMPNVSLTYVGHEENVHSNPSVARAFVDPGHANPALNRTIRDNTGTLQISVDEQKFGGTGDYGDAPLRPYTGDVIYSQPGIRGNRRPKNGEVLWTDGDDDGIVYSGTVTLHNKGGRNRPPPSYDAVDSYHQDRSMYGEDLVYDEAVFAARDSTLDRSRAKPGRRLHAERQATAPRSGKQCRRNFDDDFMAFPEERRSRPQRTASGRRRIPIEYDSDVDLEIDENEDIFKPREREVYRVYENRSRKPAEHGGKRISIISITSDDNADAARLRLLQEKQRAAAQQQHDDEGQADAGGYGATTIQLGEPRPTSPEAEHQETSETFSYKVTSAESPELVAVSPEPDLPPLVTQNDIIDQELSNGDYVQSTTTQQYKQNDSNYLAVPAPDFMYDTSNEVTEDIIIPGQKTDDKKSAGSIRSLREVIASQRGKTPPPARKERPKLTLPPSDPQFDNILNEPQPSGAGTSGTKRESTSYSQAVVPPVPPAPPPPPPSPSTATTVNGHARSDTSTRKTVYSKSNVDTSGVVMRKKEKKSEDFRGSQKSIGASKLAAQQEHEFPSDQIESIHDSLRDLDLYLKQQRDGDNVSISSHASSKNIEQFHFALTDESTPM